jgi:hypothetical protein
MPPITVTLTETEACHIRELVKEDRQGRETALRHFPNTDEVVKDFHRTIAGLDDGLLEKFKDV